MAIRFARVDLGDDSRDFQPLALEPGVPLLDKSGANAKVLSRWLGHLVAEPVWDRESVNFFARDDAGGRLEEVNCEPATSEELEKLLQDDVAELRERLDRAKPEGSTERALKKIIRQHFDETFTSASRRNTDSYVFRYRDANGRWRLVWCWGYRRVDSDDGSAVVCAADQCNLLYVRRPGESPKCPHCEALLVKRRVTSSRRRRRLLIALLLLPLLLLGLWFWYPAHLRATPEKHIGAVGSRVDVKVERRWLLWSTDVTDKATAKISDPAIAEFDAQGKQLALLAPGPATAEFQVGDLTSTVAITAETVGSGGGRPIPPRDPPEVPPVPPEPPEPRPIDVRILSDQGQSVQIGLRAIFDDFRIEAEYPDGFIRMVTRKAAIHVTAPVVVARDGRLEGRRLGKVYVSAEFQGVKTKTPLECTVVAPKPDELVITPDPVFLPLNQTAEVTVTGYVGGKSIGILSGLAGLTLRCDDPSIAMANGPKITGVHRGNTKITAEFDGVSSDPTDLYVVREPQDPLIVTSLETGIAVGQSLKVGVDVMAYLGELDVSRSCQVVPNNPRILRFIPGTRTLVGIADGTTLVTFLYGDKTANLTLKVGGPPPTGAVVIEPAYLELSPGFQRDVRVFVHTADGRRIDRTHDATLKVVDPANTDYVAVEGSRVRGLAPGSAPIEIVANVPGCEPGSAQVRVVDIPEDPPPRLICEPSPIVLPVGKWQLLTIYAQSAHGTFKLYPQDGLRLSVGGQDPGAVKLEGHELEGIRPGKVLLGIRWRNSETVVSVTVVPDKITGLYIEPADAVIAVNDPVRYVVTATRGGMRTVLTGSDVQLTVANPSVARAAENETVVIGLAEGTTTVTATVGGQTVSATLNVRRKIARKRLRIEPAFIEIKELSGRARIRVKLDGVPVPATIRTLNPAVVVPEEPFRGRLVGTGYGSAHIEAEYDGQTAIAEVRVTHIEPITVQYVLLDDPTQGPFRVKAIVTTSPTAGPLDCRVYQMNATPGEQWYPTERQGDERVAEVISEPLPARPMNSWYKLMLDFRDSKGTIVQRPTTFRLTIGIKN